MPETTEFLPFHAINEFMRPDFKLTVIRETLVSQNSLPESYMNDLNHAIKKHVSVPGFRHSDKAPALVKVIPTSKAFDKHPDLVATILTCWTEIHSILRQEVYLLLKNRNWKMYPESDGLVISNLSPENIREWPILPINLNRSKLPGFYSHWPKGEDFEILYKAYTETYPESEGSIDKVSLMVVWLSMRLPYYKDNDLNPKEL